MKRLLLFLLIVLHDSFTFASLTINMEQEMRLPNIKDVHLMPLIDLVAIRPPVNTRGFTKYPKLFAAHPDISSIKLDGEPEEVAAAFLRLRLQGVQKYPGQQFSHRFTRAMIVYLENAGISADVIDAIRGYHTLKMRSYHETKMRKETGTSRNQVRRAYLKRYRKQQREKEKQKGKFVEVPPATGPMELPPMSIALIEPLLEHLMKQFDHRPTALEVEDKLRSIQDLYASAKHGAAAMRSYLQKHEYTPEEVKIASGARCRHNRDIELEVLRKESMARRMEARQALMALNNFGSEVVSASQSITGSSAEVNPDVNWWDRVYTDEREELQEEKNNV